LVDTGIKCLQGSQVCCAQPAPVAAPAAPVASGGSGSSIVLTDPLQGIGLIGGINRLIMTFVGMVGAIALLVFVYAGVIYMTAGGDDKKVSHARDTMKYAFIGLILIMGAYILTSFYFSVLTQGSASTAVVAPTQ
jgi:hypothetical protein